ncbi:hypothetical protein HDU97_001078 [Phlyctochytrium planicorne]|nr:hypothetical protein HDU97_001078 [Phlyctochytrium planicorne]
MQTLKPIARFFKPVVDDLSPPPELTLGNSTLISTQIPQTTVNIDLPSNSFDLDVTDFSRLERRSHPPFLLEGSISVELAQDGNARKRNAALEAGQEVVTSGSLTVRLLGKYEIDVSLTNVYSAEEKDAIDLGNFSVSKGVFYLHEQTLWYGPSHSMTLHEDPNATQQPTPTPSQQPTPRTSTNPVPSSTPRPSFTPPPHQSHYMFPDPSSHPPLNFNTPYPFTFPVPLDAPVTSRTDAGRIIWVLEATLVQAGRNWPVVRKREIIVRRVSYDAPPQTVPPFPPRPHVGPPPRKQIVKGYTLQGEFEFEIQHPDPIRIPPQYDTIFQRTFRGRDGGTGLFRTRSLSPPRPLAGRRRVRSKERERSTGKPDDELYGPEGVPVQICLKNGSKNVANVHMISVTLGQRCHINTLDRFRPPHPSSLSHGTLGMWEDTSTKPIAMPSIYMGETFPPPPDQHPPPRRPKSHAPQPSSSSRPIHPTPPQSPPQDPDVSNISSSSTDTFRTALTSPTPRVLQAPPSTHRAWGPGNPHPHPRHLPPSTILRNLHTPGQIVSTKPGSYKFLKVPVGRGVGPRRVNGIGGNHVASPPLLLGDRRNSLGGMLMEGNLGRVVNARGFGGDGTKYVIEVGDGEGEGECFVGVEVGISGITQASVVQQNFKIAHYLTLNILYEAEKKTILGTGQKKLATIEIPVFVVHGAPLERGIRR